MVAQMYAINFNLPEVCLGILGEQFFNQNNSSEFVGQKREAVKYVL